MRLVDGTSAFEVALGLARVDTVPVDAAFEEAGAAWKFTEPLLLLQNHKL